MKTDPRPMFWLVLAALTLWLIYLLSPVLTPFVLAALLAYLGDPLADRLETASIGRFTLGRTGAVICVFILILGGMTLLLLVIIPTLIEQVRHFQDRMPVYLEWLVGTAIPWVREKIGLPPDAFDPDRVIGMLQVYWKEVGTAALAVLGDISAGGQRVVAWLVNLLLIPVVTFYLLRDWDSLSVKVRAQIPRDVEPKVTQLALEIGGVIGAFFRGQLMVMLALGLIYAVGLWAVGIDFAFLIGLLAGLLSIVPYLGTGVGVIVALIAAMVQYGDPLHLFLVAAVFVIGQMLEGMVLTPKIVGDRVGLHPVAVIFAVMAGGQLFGFLGMLLALPVAAVLMVLLRHANDEYLASRLYHGDSPVPVVEASETGNDSLTTGDSESGPNKD